MICDEIFLSIKIITTILTNIIHMLTNITLYKLLNRRCYTFRVRTPYYILWHPDLWQYAELLDTYTMMFILTLYTKITTTVYTIFCFACWFQYRPMTLKHLFTNEICYSSKYILRSGI